MNNYMIAIGIASILAGLIVRFHPRFVPKQEQYASNKARRVAVFDQQIRGIPNLILGVCFVGQALTANTHWQWIFAVLLGLSAIAYLIARGWIFSKTPRDSIDYEI